jgi:3' exoribonuclease, RNase T-like
MSETVVEECMVDLETLGNGNNAVILSIGACKFFPEGQGVDIHTSHRFEMFVDPQSCVDAGMQMDPSTVLWWMDPGRAEARDVLMANMKDAMPLRHALFQFANWLGGDRPVWGNGATFDNVILRNAYMLVGIECPWQFWNDRCYRTMKSIAPSVKMQRKGIHHSALADAVSQAEHLQSINRFLSGE